MHGVRGRNKEGNVWYLVRVSVVAHEVVFAYRGRSGEATVQSSNATRYDVHHNLERGNETMFPFLLHSPLVVVVAAILTLVDFAVMEKKLIGSLATSPMAG